MEITSFSQLDLTKSYTYFDYLKWRFDERVELFKGKVVKMSPAPSSYHQGITGEIFYLLKDYLRKSNCKVFIAPFDVRLERIKDDKSITTVVQPDICVICDETKIDIRGCLGAPELIIEILSPGNTNKEMNQKFDLYEEAGVMEYWIVDPEKEIILQYFNQAGRFVSFKPVSKSQTLTCKVLPGFVMELASLF